MNQLPRPSFRPQLDFGGPISGPSLVGEGGPEIFVPSRPGMILPNSVLRDIQAGGGDEIIVNQTLNVSPGVPETVRREVISMLPMIRGQAVDAVRDAVGRGGNAAKEFGRRR